MTDLPRGTVSLLFTDIEGSTRLLEAVGAERYVPSLEEHRRLLREAFTGRGGVEVEMQGDSFHFAFVDARDAVLAAVDARRALAEHDWQGEPIRVRIGIHTGEPLVSGTLYAGLDVHRAARVMSAGHGGQILVSASTRAAVGDGSRDGLTFRDLGEHRLKDLSSPQRLFQVGDEDFPPLKSLYRTNLPVPATSFLGRERELQEITAVLASDDVRLLTLTGAGGTGKTRLAAQAAADVAELFPDGIFWVGLAALRDHTLVAESVATALDAPGDLTQHVGGKRMLVVLDNFEHVVDAATDIGDLLDACPELVALVTSREPLHLASEREYPVPPLREPDAVALFQERARAVGVGIDADPMIEKISRRLDHLPLAIELAAARVKALVPVELLERLELRLPLLTGGPRDAPERQRTLRSTIAWSYELLTRQEQELFARVAVFSGGFTVGAAEQVCEADLDILQSLVEKSLLRHTESRFSMLETIREYADERLAESKRDEELRERHAQFFLGLARDIYPDRRGPSQAAWLARLKADQDNFRAGLDWALVHEPELAVELAGYLWGLWLVRCQLGEGRQWLRATLEAAPDAPTRSTALRGLANISVELGDLDSAAEAAEEALELARAAGDEEGAAFARGVLADIVWYRGDLDAAETLYGEAADEARRRGDRVELALTLGNLGAVACDRGDLRLAEERQLESLAIFREEADTIGQGICLVALARVASGRGDHTQAFSWARSGVELLLGVGNVMQLHDTVGAFAMLHGQAGNARVAARLWGAHAALSTEAGHELDRFRAIERDELLEWARSSLGDEEFTRLFDVGSAMTLDEAIAHALEHDPATQSV